jgi:wyosine [tRNA(Phe)-imidazoG37] synthetase (radical SAM superfamily)
MISEAASLQPKRQNGHTNGVGGSAFGRPRDFLGNRFVYVVVSARARGLSIGVNMNPDKRCNFDCAYCEVNHNNVSSDQAMDVDVMADELQRTLAFVFSGALQSVEQYRHVPRELLQLRHVTLSGDGEPTLSPNFLDTLRAVVHVRALNPYSFFKIVLITNASGLDLPEVQAGLKLFTKQDEIWAKLDAGTQEYMDKVNGPADCKLEKILTNIRLVAKERPVIIQSLFPDLNGTEPTEKEIEEYALKLRGLKNAGAQIPLVQIYSCARPVPNSHCSHLPLKSLSQIAARVREVSKLKAEVF